MVSFLIVGGLSTGFNYLIFWICLDFLRLYYVLSGCIGYVAGLCLGFFLNVRFTFQMAGKISKHHPFLYMAVYLTSLALSALTLYSFVTYLKIHPKTANLISIAQSTVTNYLGCRYLVFRKPGHVA